MSEIRRATQVLRDALEYYAGYRGDAWDSNKDVPQLANIILDQGKIAKFALANSTPPAPSAPSGGAAQVKLDQMARSTTILAMELAYKCLQSFTIQSTHPEAARVRDICYTLLSVKHHRAQPDETGEWMRGEIWREAATAPKPAPWSTCGEATFDPEIASQPAPVAPASVGPVEDGEKWDLIARARCWTEKDLRKFPSATLELMDALANELAIIKAGWSERQGRSELSKDKV